MTWWSAGDVDWSLPEPRRVRQLLMNAYDERPAIKRVVEEANLIWARAPGGLASAEDLWTWAIESSVTSGLLFELCGRVLADRSKKAYHEQLRKLFGGGVAMGDAKHLTPEGGQAPSLESLAIMNEALRDAAEDRAGGLQSISNASLGFIDSQQDLQVRRDSLRRTAMIQIAGQPRGTGFLVGPDLLLTAAHVLDQGNWPPQLALGSVTVTFDFLPQPHLAPDETGYRASVRGWLAGSLPTPAETKNQSNDWNAPLTHLDFALLQLMEAAADRIIDGSARGFYQLHEQPYQFDNSAQLRIPQHPLGQTQVTSVVAGPFEKNLNGTRIRYGGNTLPGSSGSAVLDARGRLVALHHFSGPGFNQGVPIDLIAAALRKFGVPIPVPGPAAASASPPGVAVAKPTNGAGANGAGPNERQNSPFFTTSVAYRPFADREDLRKTVQAMLQPNEKRILLIGGGPDSGKSYSWRYFAHLEAASEHQEVKAHAPQGIRALKVNLEEWQSTPRSELCRELLNHVATTMRLNEDGKMAQSVRSVSELVSTLDARLNGTPTIWWLVFDSLDKYRPLDQGVEELIKGLCQLVDSKPALPLRVVLCSRDKIDLPGDLASWAFTDYAKGLQRKDVETWLRRRADENSRGVDENALLAKLDQWFPQVGASVSALALGSQLDGALKEVMQ